METKPEAFIPYYECSVYPSQAHSGNAHILIHFIIYLRHVPLSCYQVTEGKEYFLVVVGIEPDPQTKLRIREALSSGQPVELSTEVVNQFVERHLLEKKRGIK